MCVIGVSVHQAHRHRLTTIGEQLIDGRVDTRPVEVGYHRSVMVNSLANLGDIAPSDQRLGLADVEIVDLVTFLATDDQYIFEAFSGDEPGRRTLSLEHGVGGNGGCVQQAANLLRANAGLAEQAPGAGQHGVLRRARRAGEFEKMTAAGRAIVKYEVGESTANVEG